MDKILFTRTRAVKAPTRANIHDAGIDFFMPVVDDVMVEDLKKKNPQQYYYTGDENTENSYLVIPPHQRILIPSGIKVWINPKNTALIAFNKSGVSTKRGIDVLACVVDADYTGEVHLSLLNTSDDDVIFKSGDKVVQFIHTPILLTDMEEIDIDKYNQEVAKVGTDRGEGGFGSTDKKKK